MEVVEKPLRQPMESVSCDVLTYGGKEILLTVDNFLGYVWLSEYRGASPTSGVIIQCIWVPQEAEVGWGTNFQLQRD